MRSREIAMTVALHLSRNEAVVATDADLWVAPEFIPALPLLASARESHRGESNHGCLHPSMRDGVSHPTARLPDASLSRHYGVRQGSVAMLNCVQRTRAGREVAQPGGTTTLTPPSRSLPWDRLDLSKNG